MDLFGCQLVSPDPAAYQPDRTRLQEFSQAYKPFNTGALHSQSAKHDSMPGFVCQHFTLSNLQLVCSLPDCIKWQLTLCTNCSKCLLFKISL